MSKWILLLILFPFLEILILIKMGEALGFWTTVLIVFGIAFFGGFLSRLEGVRAWSNFHRALQKGKMPGEHMIDAFLIFVAGILLIIPGFLSDIAGILLLIPWTRFIFKRWLRKKFDRIIRDAKTTQSIQYRFFLR